MVRPPATDKSFYVRGNRDRADDTATLSVYQRVVRRGGRCRRRQSWQQRSVAS